MRTRCVVCCSMHVSIYHLLFSIAAPVTCPANQVFNPCCQLASCDRNCTTKDDVIACPKICGPRCCCPRDKPLLDVDGVTCISRDQCPPTDGECPATQTRQSCCTPDACRRRCSDITNPPGFLCAAVCVQDACCCPPERPFLADDGVTCVPGTECPTNPCAAISCLVGFVCDPVIGECVNPNPPRK